jgi:hypothetical protein
MWRWKYRKQHEPPENRSGTRKPEDRGKGKSPGSPTSQQDRIMQLTKSGMLRTALDEVLRGLRQDPDDFFLLQLGATIASATRTGNLRAAEPTSSAQRRSALLAPVVTECSSCKRTWYSNHWASPGPIESHKNPHGLQCQKCRYTLCRDCLDHEELSPNDPIDKPMVVMDACPERHHGVLGSPVLATGRSDVTSIKPDRIEAVIVTRDGPIPPTMDEALDAVTRYVPLIADDAPLIYIRPSKPGLMTEKLGREELALTHIHDLEREGVLALGALNRSECISAEIRDAADGNYLLIVIAEAAASAPGNANVPSPPSIIIDRILAAVEGLPVARDDDVQYDYDFAGPKWGSREILVLTGDELRRRIEAVCAADAASGFMTIDMSAFSEASRDNALPYVQLNTLRDTPGAFRPYRITKRNDGRFAVYGHAALYSA